MIRVSNLTKTYGPRAAIQDISFEVGKGQIVGFLGPNGAGKSTTMKILTAFMPATSGTVHIAGFEVFENPLEVKKRVGYLPENPPVYLDMLVADYLSFAAKIHGVESNKVRAAVDRVLEKVALGDVRGRLIGNLSKGYRQRVGLAQAILHEPEVLILDEPTVGLDPKQIIEIRNVIRGLAGQHTVILSSHILPEVTATCQRVIVINRGKIVDQGTIEELSSHLHKGLVYSISVKKPSPDGLKSIQTIPGVHRVTDQGSKWMIEMDPNAGEIRDRIVDVAVQKGLGVLEFRSEKMSLEEVFLELTTNESPEAHA